MIKNILAYGDSFTAGHGIDTDDAWPTVLGNMLGIPSKNNGVRGGSNKLSIINLLNDFSNIENPSETLVGFSWTSAARTCFYDFGWQNILPNFDDHRDYINDFSRNYYGHVYNDIDALNEIVLQQIFLTAFLKEKNIKYFFINSLKDISPESLSKTAKSEMYIKEHENFLSLLDKEKFLLGYNNSIYSDFCQNLGMVSDDGFHPNTEAHKMIATRAFWFLKDQNIL
jgi:lysophospholipase L1-like esterase